MPYTRAMTLKEGGVLVSRGLAIYFLAQSLTLVLFSLEYTPGFWGNSSWLKPGMYLAQAALNFLLAGFLWRGADKFAPNVPSSAGPAPIDQSGLLRVLVAAIAVYWFVNFTSLLLTQVVSYLQGAWKPSYTPALIKDAIMMAVAAATYLWAAKGLTLSRMASYPRSETDVE
jgi:hypothetical protein